jgi:hypothetical protein
MSYKESTNSLEKLVQIQDHVKYDANKKEYISCAITSATTGLVIAVIIAGIIILFLSNMSTNTKGFGGMNGGIILSFIVIGIGFANYLYAPNLAELQFNKEVVKLTDRLKKQGITSSQDLEYKKARDNTSYINPQDLTVSISQEKKDRLDNAPLNKTSDFSTRRKGGACEDTDSIASEELFGNIDGLRVDDFTSNKNKNDIILGGADTLGF